MPTKIGLAIAIALVFVLALYSVSWFKGKAWPLGVLAAIMVVSSLHFLFSHWRPSLVFGVSIPVGIVAFIGYCVWSFADAVHRYRKMYHDD